MIHFLTLSDFSNRGTISFSSVSFICWVNICFIVSFLHFQLSSLESFTRQTLIESVSASLSTRAWRICYKSILSKQKELFKSSFVLFIRPRFFLFLNVEVNPSPNISINDGKGSSSSTNSECEIIAVITFEIPISQLSDSRARLCLLLL